MAQNLDIVTLIHNNPIKGIYNNTKIIEKINNYFNNDEQKLFIANFYCYLNYDQDNDYIINLKNIWKWIGFSRLDPAVRLLKKEFKENIDYKIYGNNTIEPATPIGGAAFSIDEAKNNEFKENIDYKIYVNEHDVFAPPIGGAKNDDNRGGFSS
jgi:hypothetical protein